MLAAGAAGFGASDRSPGDAPSASLPPRPSLFSRSRSSLLIAPTHALHGRHRIDGQARLPRQAARLRLPVLRDLRRARVGLGLRPARRRAQEEREGPLVAGHGPRPRRHRGARCRHPHAPARLGGLRPRRRLHRSAGGLQALQEPLPRRRSPDQGHPGPAGRAVPRLRQPRDADRAADVQPDVQDVHGPGRGAGGGGLPAAGDGAGDLRQLPQRAAELAAEDPVRHRPDRQGVPQRDHARQLHLPHARVRADGDAVLREARAPTPSGSSAGASGGWSGITRSA